MIESMASFKAIRDDYPGYCERIKARLDVGATLYGDKSLSRSPKELLKEIQEEIEDIAGWGFMLHCRVKKLIEALERVD
jgi:hypothetical protein